MRTILPLRQQHAWIDENLPAKLDLIPDMMKMFGIDMWIIFAREYNEDPIMQFITPTNFPTARRLSCFIFANTKDGFKRYNAGRPSGELDPYYESVFNDIDEKQFDVIKDLILEINPKTIGLNQSTYYAVADGLTKRIYDDFASRMPQDILDRCVSAEKLAVHFLETRLPVEIEKYYEVCELAMNIVEEGFSSSAITVGKTTNKDLVWWLKEEVNRLGLPFWFGPTIDIQRKDSGPLWDETIILPGDLLHVDFGLTYLGLCTDHQRLAYVPMEGETEIPTYLLEGFKINNRFQDIVTSHYEAGKTGNDVFLVSVEQAKSEGINPMLYTHPIGHFGHGPGPTIGLFNQQSFIKGRGEYPLYPNTCYALELNIKTMVPEFSDKEVLFFSEETICFDGEKCHYLAKGRKNIYFVK